MGANIRMATEADAAAIANIYGHYVLTSPATFETLPPDEDEMRNRVKLTTEMFPWLVMEGDDGLQGYAYAGRHRERPAYQWATDVSAYIHKDHHRQGVGRRLYSALLDIVRNQGFVTACAGITMPNEASVGLHLAMGFELIGVYRHVGYKLGQWHDTSWWQLQLIPRQDQPKPPKSWHELDFDAFEVKRA